ncbi:pilus assembly FimT family protein [Anabaena azotica]|uniref:Type II secretion system protein n=1 Tax=Anabaena azotica FACHB-119 TaxID=947527 RepID=A0ABR8D3N8_9NOST|nr:type II secretion system protein [Anabaena azotica]MBD2500872.1 type II secretion system protein [Anabaena azotica FACHB-119]
MKTINFDRVFIQKLINENLPRVSAIKSRENNNSGFTLVEIITVVLIIGVLAVILAPNWLSFVNRQRVGKANDAVLAAIQEAQRQAKQKKLSYSVSFRTENNIPQFAVYPGTTPTNWRNLTEDLDIRPGQIALGTNLSNVNTARTSVNYRESFNTSAPQTITFDYMGVLAPKTNNTRADTGLRVVIAVPQSNNITNGSMKRCVMIETLIGAIRTARDTDCN